MAKPEALHIGEDYIRKYGFYDTLQPVFQTGRGLNRRVVEEISYEKGEPKWMRDFRLRAYEIFISKPMPTWGPDLSGLNFDEIVYYIKPTERKGRSWDEVPDEIKRTFDRLGIPEWERKFLAGVGAQYDCLTADTMVFTEDGAVRIADIKAGQFVFSLDPSTRCLIKQRVRGVAYKGQRAVFEVRVAGRTIKATFNHPFYALVYEKPEDKQRGRFRTEWRYLSDLKVGDYIAITKQIPDDGKSYTLPQIVSERTYKGRNQFGEFASRTTYKGQTTERLGYRFLITGDLTPLTEYSVKVQLNHSPRQYYHQYNSHHGSPLDAYTSEDISFAPIESITYIGFEDTFDIEVEGVHNFVAEGIIVHNSEVVYHNLAKQWEEQGVIFVDTDTAVRDYPDLVQEYFGTVIPPHDNKFAALNSAVWSGGSFVYVPAGVHVEIPLQAYFRINAKNAGQFERTLIIAEEGSFVHYVEGCLPAGEQVATPSGWVNIESLKPGDYVLDEKGHPVRIRAVMTRPYKGELIKIRPISPHNTFQLTPEHPVLCVRREQVQAPRRARKPHWQVEVDTRVLLSAQPEYVPAGELREGDFIVFPKPQPTSDAVPFTAEQMRLLGYYLAEGSAYVHRTLKTPMVTFTVGEHETEIIQDLTHLIEHLTGKRAQVVHQPKRHAVNITAYSRELMEFCLEHVGRRASTKQLSETIMHLPAEALRPLIDAYFAGDGNICWKGNSEMHRVNTASQTLARQLQALLARLGIYASIEHRHGGEDTIQGRRIHRKEQYLVVWTNNRRTGEVRDAGDYFLVPIKQIQRMPYEGFVFNLDVESPHSYLVRGFATHNCTAPVYAEEALHSAVVEIIVKRGARVRYTTIQNWSKDVYNLVTKRSVVYGDAIMEWVDGNLGCVAAGELVYTAHGPVPIEQVLPGTQVWSFDEANRCWVLRPVVARKESGLQRVYEIAFSNGRTVRLTDNHPLLVVEHDPSCPRKLTRYSLCWKPVAQLQHGDWVVCPTSLQADGQPYRFIQPIHRRNLRGFRATKLLTESMGIARVEAIRPSVIVPTYDLEVKEAHSFIVNGILVHNSRVTMKYPSVYLMEPGARGEVLSVAFAGDGQHQDTGGKAIHAAPYTSSRITSKSISKGTGRASYRGLVQVLEGAHHSKCNVECDALLLDENARTDTYPFIEVNEQQVTIGHEARVSKVSEEQLFYLQSRGLKKDEALTLIVSGFIEPLAKQLPMEYAVELNRLIELEMEGSVG